MNNFNDLSETLKQYNILSERLIYDGGEYKLFGEMSDILNKKILIGTYAFALVNPQMIQHAVNELSNGSVCFEVRTTKYKLPSYYLCRLARRSWADESVIIEDICKSKQYPINDNRFVSLMSGGYEKKYLRTAQFRNDIISKQYLKNSKKKNIDTLLFDIGNDVFQSAWHEDQLLGISIAKHFDLVKFKQLIEVLYFCLSSDLYAVKYNIKSVHIEFFKDIYEQPSILKLLNYLKNNDSIQFNTLHENALKNYKLLSKQFSHFLKSKVKFKKNKDEIEIYKLMFSNLYRLDSIKDSIIDNKRFMSECEELESSSEIILKRMLNFKNI